MKRQTPTIRRPLALMLLVATAVAGGCASDPPVAFHVAPWRDAVADGARSSASSAVIRTQHYALHTTLAKAALERDLAAVMEGAYRQYRALAPFAPQTPRPMDGYVFAERDEWEDFTRRHFGEDAVYLRINRGGYTVGDIFAMHHTDAGPTFVTLAHEGWHQFVSRHFEGRIPPFLDEGLACTFEGVQVRSGRVRWDVKENPTRLNALRRAAAEGFLWPLEELITTDAGQTVRLAPQRIEAFYAQCWALARFLEEADGGQYRPALRALLSDAAGGHLHDPTGVLNTRSTLWAPSGARPMLEYYLREDLETIDRQYREFVGQLIGTN